MEISKYNLDTSEEELIKACQNFENAGGSTDAEASEAANNLVGFFDLLLKVDMRNNPQRYKPKKKKK